MSSYFTIAEFFECVDKEALKEACFAAPDEAEALAELCELYPGEESGQGEVLMAFREAEDALERASGIKVFSVLREENE